ncbi:hypothetical protein SCUCBS95973_007072 [Sporothrix curviconia]|uniref:Zn(2)-C6 fungal-type domain-containing protein n=1 Tax=Sporothrix curviconia TaxID=1260050 RepID=A0ABP0CAE4_9PEZI
MDDDRSSSSVIGGAPRLLPKRSRAALACNACRKVKSKCDGARPSCTRCSRQNTECVYTLNVNDRRMDRQEERRAHLALKHKVSELEARLAAKGSPNERGMVMMGGDESEDDSPAQAPSNAGLSDAGSRGTNAGSAVDALATGAFDHRPAAEIGYFGPTSNHAMFRSVTTAMVNSGYRLTVLRQQEEEDHQGGGGHNAVAARHSRGSVPIMPSVAANSHQTRPIPFTDAAAISGGGGSASMAASGAGGRRGDDINSTTTATNNSNNYHYPSPTVARQWVTLFFDTVGAMLPYVSETSLLKEIEAAAGDRSALRSRSTEGLLSIVFAHALVAAGKEDVAEPFYHRAVALQLLEEQAVATPTMYTVQALLLLGSFQQNSQRAMASLATHALAVKASYQLGLHSPSTYEGLSTPDKELRAKLWFAVVNQDMILGTGLGRPCLIPPAYVQYQMLDSVAPSLLDATPGGGGGLGAVGGGSLSLSTESESMYYYRHLSALHEIMGVAVETVYGANIGVAPLLSADATTAPRELVAKTMDLLFRLQTWQAGLRPFGIVTGLQAQQLFGVWPAAKFQAERYSIALSVYYYKTVMLVCAPLLMRVLELVTDRDSASKAAAAAAGVATTTPVPPVASTGSAGTAASTTRAAAGVAGAASAAGSVDTASSFNSMLMEMAAPVLRKELHAIGEYQWIANGLLRHQPSFFKANAIWWVCNFNSLTMSLHLFGLWLVCILSDTMAAAMNSSMAAVEAVLLEAIEILRGVGGTSMMSVKAYHSLKRYMRLARAIVPSNQAMAAGSAPPLNFDELLQGHQQQVQQHQEQPNPFGLPSSHHTPHQQHQVTHHHHHHQQQQQQPHQPSGHLGPEQHDPGSLFSSGAFLWDGFPDAGMNYVGDMFYQQLEGDFLGNSSIGGLGGDFDMQLDRVP